MSVSSVTPSGTCLDRNEAGCIAEIKAFLKGGSDGAKRLKEVISSLFVYFKIVTSNEKANVLLKCGLSPYRTKSDVSFFFVKSDVKDQFSTPKDYNGFDWDKESHDGSSDSDGHEPVVEADLLDATLDVADSSC